MKNYKVVLILLYFLCFSQAAFCKSSLGDRVKLQDSSSVSSQANKGSSFDSSNEIFNDPVIQSTLGGFANMMQTMGDGSYNPQERQKQQVEYAKQQMGTSE